jgi:hypothetical protein
MIEWNKEEVDKIEVDIKMRAMTDPEFRALALNDPPAAVTKVTSKPLPPGFRVRFVENDGANLTVVLPDPVSATHELADAELEQVAGGDRYNANANIV